MAASVTARHRWTCGEHDWLLEQHVDPKQALEYPRRFTAREVRDLIAAGVPPSAADMAPADWTADDLLDPT